MAKWMPAELSKIDEAFPAIVKHLMPKMEEIPEEFHHWHGTVWNELVGDWFFSGVDNLRMTPKEGIDREKAMRHIKTILGSWEPQHEHKEAAVAYLLSLWFENPTWEKAKPKKGEQHAQ